MILEENGKSYRIEGGKIVEAAEGALTEAPAPAVIEFKINDRVEAGGRLGKIVLKSNSIYGPYLTVAHDDGGTESYFPADIKRSDIEPPTYESALAEIDALYADYESTPAYTEEEIEHKAKLAHLINLKAKALSTDASLGLTVLASLDRMVTATAVDLLDFADAIKIFAAKKRTEMTSPRDRMSHSVTRRTGFSEDASWLDSLEVESSVDLSDGELAQKAWSVVSQYGHSRLSDDAFMLSVLENSIPGIPEAHRERFAELVEAGRQQILSDPEPQTKVAAAAAKIDLSTFDATEIYL